MVEVLRWRRRNGLTQVAAARMLGVSQTYLSLVENGVRPLTGALRERMEEEKGSSDDLFRVQLGRLGYPGFAHVVGEGRRPRPGALLMAVLARAEADARVVEALPWLVRAFEDQLDFGAMVREAKLRNLQNRLGFLLAVAGVGTAAGGEAVRELERSRLLGEDTLCWDSMPGATREWIRGNRSPLAAHWNVLTRLQGDDVPDAA